MLGLEDLGLQLICTTGGSVASVTDLSASYGALPAQRGVAAFAGQEIQTQGKG